MMFQTLKLRSRQNWRVQNDAFGLQYDRFREPILSVG